MAYLTMAAGAYLAAGAFMMDTTGGWTGAALFRAVPGLIGFGLLIAGAKMAGFI